MDPATLLKEFGPVLCMLGYFVWKDYKFTERIVSLMAKLEAYMGLDDDKEEKLP